MNQITIIGNLTKDPITGNTQGGIAYAHFTVAVNRNDKDKNVDYFDVGTWRTQAENCAKYLAKGKKVAVTGPMYSGKYTDKQGQERTKWEIQAYNVEFLTPVEKSSYDMKPASEPTPFDNEQVPLPPDGSLPF